MSTSKQDRIWSDFWKADSLKYDIDDFSKPSRAIKLLLEYFKKNDIKPDGFKILDLACGLARNSISLLNTPGFESAICVDLSHEALTKSKEITKKLGLMGSVEYLNQKIDEPLDIQDSSIDIALDIYGSMCLFEDGRSRVKSQILKKLKPNGYLLVYLISSESEFVKSQLSISPAKEPNSFYHSDNHQFEKAFTTDEIKLFYADFQILDFQKVKYLGENPMEMFFVLMKNV